MASASFRVLGCAAVWVSLSLWSTASTAQLNLHDDPLIRAVPNLLSKHECQAVLRRYGDDVRAQTIGGSSSSQDAAKITDFGLSHLRHFGKTLTSLNILGAVEITDKGMIELLPHIPLLKDLSVSNCSKISDGTLEALQNHVHLGFIDFERTAITGSGFKFCKKLTSLSCVLLASCYNLKDVEKLIPLDDVLDEGAYVDLNRCGFFVARRLSNDSKLLIDDLYERIFEKSAKLGMYIDGDY